MTKNKLTNTDVIDIRRDFNNGKTTMELATTYDVTQRTIQRILDGTRWASIPADKPLKEFGNKYELTVDGRIWSTTADKYVAINNGTARLSHNGRKITVNTETLVSKYF